MNNDPNTAHLPRVRSLGSGGGEERQARETISPELVLVDPELAAWARAQLVADAEEEARARAQPRAARSEPVAPFVGECAAGAAADAVGEASSGTMRERPAKPSRQRRPSRAGLALVIAAALLTVIALMPRSASDRPILAAGVRAQNSTASLADAQAASAPQTFAWSAVEATRGYEVILYRGARKILVARTIEPRLTVARRWIYRGRSFTLSPGSYRWYVWPLGLERSVRGARKPIVEAKLVVVER